MNFYLSRFWFSSDQNRGDAGRLFKVCLTARYVKNTAKGSGLVNPKPEPFKVFRFSSVPFGSFYPPEPASLS